MESIKFEFTSIKETKDGKFANFKGSSIVGSTEVKIVLSTYLEDELEELHRVVEKAKLQAIKDFNRTLPRE